MLETTSQAPPRFTNTCVSQTRRDHDSPAFVLAAAVVMPVEQATSPQTWT